MSKQLVDGLVEEFLDKHRSRWDTVLRRVMNGNPQRTTITKEDLITLYRDNTIAALYTNKSFKEAQEAADRVKGIEEAAIDAAEYVFTNFESFYKKKRGHDIKGRIKRTPNKIVISQPQGLFNAIKDIIIKEGWNHIKVSPHLSEQSRKQIASDEAYKKMRQSTQILHEGKRTVGTFILANLYKELMETTVIKGFTESQTTVIASTVEEFFGAIESDWIKMTDMGERSLDDTLEIPLTIGPSSENPPGSEAYDWSQLRKGLEAEIRAAAKAGKLPERYATEKGSKPLTQKAQERALHIVTDKISSSVQGKRSISATVSKLPKEDPKKVRYSGKAKTKGAIKKAKSRGVTRKSYPKVSAGNKVPPPRMELRNILGVLNNQLPERVASNMGSPRLENRTGRFAQSVRATDVAQTPQGFPSIGYTYMRNRYGVYESTSGTRYADVERDPRTLIDQSIREIVIGFGLGRIYTRRQ